MIFQFNARAILSYTSNAGSASTCVAVRVLNSKMPHARQKFHLLIIIIIKTSRQQQQQQVLEMNKSISRYTAARSDVFSADFKNNIDNARE